MSVGEELGQSLEGLTEGAGAVGGLVANHLWQATLFAAALVLLSFLLPRAPARLRHSLYLLASAKFLLPSALVAAVAGALGAGWLPEVLAPAWLDPTVWIHRLKSLAGFGAAAGGSAADAPLTWPALLLGPWLAVAALLFGRWALRRRRFASLLAAARRASTGAEHARLEGRLQELAARLGLRRRVSLALSAEVTEPGVWGVRRPVVLLPADVARHLEPEELDAVLLHELVHVERWDNLVGDVHMVLCCLFWFHPLLWWLDRRLLAERERACDDRVVALSGASRPYAWRGCLPPGARTCAGASTASSPATLRRRP